MGHFSVKKSDPPGVGHFSVNKSDPPARGLGLARRGSLRVGHLWVTFPPSIRWVTFLPHLSQKPSICFYVLQMFWRHATCLETAFLSVGLCSMEVLTPCSFASGRTCSLPFRLAALALTTLYRSTPGAAAFSRLVTYELLIFLDLLSN